MAAAWWRDIVRYAGIVLGASYVLTSLAVAADVQVLSWRLLGRRPAESAASSEEPEGASGAEEQAAFQRARVHAWVVLVFNVAVGVGACVVPWLEGYGAQFHAILLAAMALVLHGVFSLQSPDTGGMVWSIQAFWEIACGVAMFFRWAPARGGTLLLGGVGFLMALGTYPVFREFMGQARPPLMAWVYAFNDLLWFALIAWFFSRHWLVAWCEPERRDVFEP